MTGTTSKPKAGLLAMAAAVVGLGSIANSAGRKIKHIMHPRCEEAIKYIRQLADSRKPSSVMRGLPHSNRKCPHHPPRLTKTQTRRAKRRFIVDHSTRIAKANRLREKLLRRRRMHLERLAFGRTFTHRNAVA